MLRLLRWYRHWIHAFYSFIAYLALIILILCLKKLVPVKEKLAMLKKNAEPYLEKVSTKSVEAYEASRDAVTPHVVKLKAFSDPYFQVPLVCYANCC
jgi:uncharacterized membrane protein required for colicin V production